MGKVVILNVITKLNLSAERVLTAAFEADLEGAVVLGYTKDGSEYFASSYAAGPEALWLMERLKKKLLEITDGS